MTSLFRKHFLAGVLVLVPIVVILWIFTWMLGFLEGFFALVPDSALPRNLFPSAIASLLNFVFLLGVAVVLVALISLLGFFSKLYLGKKLIAWIGHGIQRIPVLGTLYSTVDQLVRALNQGEGGKQFHRVVLLEYPRAGVWAVGFVTGPFLQKSMPAGYLNVFVPTVPNPTSGFHLIVKESEVRDSHLKVDEAFKLILSLGIAQGTEGETS